MGMKTAMLADRRSIVCRATSSATRSTTTMTSSTVRESARIGAVRGQPLLRSNAWEDVADGGDPAVPPRIDEQMRGKNCEVVLIGTYTAGLRWVEYELKKARRD